MKFNELYESVLNESGWKYLDWEHDKYFIKYFPDPGILGFAKKFAKFVEKGGNPPKGYRQGKDPFNSSYKYGRDKDAKVETDESTGLIKIQRIG